MKSQKTQEIINNIWSNTGKYSPIKGSLSTAQFVRMSSFRPRVVATGTISFTQTHAIINNMTSRYKTISNAIASSPLPPVNLDEHWQKILSLAGVWEGDEEALTIESLNEMRLAAWGTRLDDLDADSNLNNSI